MKPARIVAVPIRKARKLANGWNKGRSVAWMLGLALVSALAGCGGAAGEQPVVTFSAPPQAQAAAAATIPGTGSLGHRRFAFTGHTLVRITFRHRAQAQQLVDQGVDLFYHRDNWAVAEVDEAHLRGLRARTDLQVERLSPRDGYTIKNNFDQGYHTYATMTADLQALAEARPQLLRLSSLGKSFEGTRDVWAVRISGPGDADKKPGVVFMGAHHAREIVTPEICLLLARHLLDNYDKVPAVARLVDGHDIWIVPMVNPDGHVLAEQGEDWRKNTNNPRNQPLTGGPGGPGVDLNRNYGYKWGGPGSGSDPSSATYRGRSAFSEPETQAVRGLFLRQQNIKMAMSYHSFSNLVLWPWGYTSDPAPDQKRLEAIGKKLASFNGYKPEQGSDLYVTTGDSDDWIYGELKIPAFTTEIGGWDDYFDPPFASLPRFWDENRPGALYLIEQAK